MKCIILAAGFGKRLYPLTENTPKPFVEVGGKTVIDTLIDNLYSTKSIDEFVIVTNNKFYNNYLAWSRDRKEKIEIINNGVSIDTDIRGVLYDLNYVIEKLSVNEDCVICAANIMFDFSLISFMDFCKRKDTSCCLRYYEENEIKLRKNLVINVNVSDKIIAIEHKPVDPNSYWICPQFLYLKATDLLKTKEALSDGCNPDSLGEFTCYISKTSPLHSMEIPGKFFRITNDVSLKKARKEFVPYL